MISRVFGLLRDMAIANAFGSKQTADAFFVAFRIPNLLRRLFAEGALTISFVPIFTETLKRDREEARRVVDISFSLMVVVLTGVSIVGILVAPWLVRLTAWGFTRDPEKFALTVFLTRVMFPYILLISLAALAMGVLNSLKHFASPAAASIFMNIGIIAGALWFTHWFHPPILGLAVGVMVGGVMQLACHFPYLKPFGFWPRLAWDPKHPVVKKVMGMMLPAAYGAAVYQFNVIVITLLASFLPTGSVSYLWYADRIMEFPLGVFAISLATVVLPSLSDHAADQDHEAFKETFRYGLRFVLLITLPAMVGMIVLSHPIIHILFQHGSFTELASEKTSQALICYALGLPFIAAVRMTSNAFFALQDSKQPVRVANQSVLVNIVFCLLLMWPLKHNGLALAVSIASAYNLIMHLVHFRKKVGLLGLKKVFSASLRMALGALLMGFILFYLQRFISQDQRLMSQVLSLSCLVMIGMVCYFVFLRLLGVEEVKNLRALLRKKRV